MPQMELFAHDMKGTPGAIWWEGNWQCRNRNGFYQVREGGRGHWEYVIYAFGDTSANVYRFAKDGTLYRQDVPIQCEDHLCIDGRLYGRDHWRH